MRSKTFLASCCLGNFFEHYDTALFGFLSPFLAPIIFPHHDKVTALILTYAIIPFGMLVRPLGALFFGFLAEKHGRQQALFFSLIGMAFISLSIAFTPTYEQVGFISPLCFYMARLFQNFFAAGEIMGGAIVLLEHTPEKKQNFFSSLFSASTIGGILLASAAVALFASYPEGWRYLYLFGTITALCGTLIRWCTPPLFQEKISKEKAFSFRSSCKKQFQMCWDNKQALFLIAIAAAFSYANYSMALVLINGYVPLVSTISAETMIQLNTFLLVLDFCALPLFGWLAERISGEKLMLLASLMVVFLASPLIFYTQGASIPTIIAIRILFILFGVAYAAPLHAWAQQLVPTQCRYTVISFGYAIGSQLLGGQTASLSLWLYHSTGISSSICWYWIILASFAASAAYYSLQKKEGANLESI